MSTLHEKIRISLYALLFLTGILALSVLLEGCTDHCDVTTEYVYYEPVYHTLEEVRNAVSISEPRPVRAIGKIYFKDNFLFINEPGLGIHIIDNREPSQPLITSFVNIPGNYDLAIKGNSLYADSYVDLLVFDISDINNIHLSKRMESTFKNYNSFGFQ